MRDFIARVKTEAFKRGGKIWQFFAGCINRAENFMKTGWNVAIEKAQDMDEATSVEIFYIIYKFPDILAKRDRYRVREDRIISEINYILSHEGIKDWTMKKVSDWIFGTSTIHFGAVRPKPTLTIGKTSLWEATQIVGQLLLLKGFFITGVVIIKNGVWLYHAWHETPTSTETFEIMNLMTFYERENAIDDVVETTIENMAKGEQRKAALSFWERIEMWAKIILVILVVLAVTYILSEWRKTGEFFKKGLDIVRGKD
jgi:hypothetical protein